jgi:hypothetical protein
VRGFDDKTLRFRAWKLALGTLAGAAALACSTPPVDSGPTYQDEVSRWTGEREADLVTSWGMPQKTHVLADGGRIIEYRSQGEKTEDTCTTRFTLDRSGKVVRSWYNGISCTVPKSS